MGLRFTPASRTFVIPSLAVWATLAIASAGYAFSWGWLANPPATDKTPGQEQAKPKAKHASVAALRDRMLMSYHGKTTDLFTSIPGFGMERMTPLYKYIPFEIPDLSTSDVEVEKEIATPELLKDVFAKSLDGFRDPSKPLPVKKDGAFNPFEAPRNGGFNGAFGNVVMIGMQLRLLDLVGLINADGPKVYSGGKAFEVQRMSFEEAKTSRAKNSGIGFEFGARPIRSAKGGEPGHDKVDTAKLETRALDIFEITGVAELNQGKDLFVRYRGNVIRMLGRSCATEQVPRMSQRQQEGGLAWGILVYLR